MNKQYQEFFIDKYQRRFSKKARIQCHEELADAFNIVTKKLEAETEKKADLDNEISSSKLPDHLQFLVSFAWSRSLDEAIGLTVLRSFLLLRHLTTLLILPPR